MPYLDRLPGDRIFARIRALDFACPQCGRVYVINPQTPASIYNRRTGVFHCQRECSLVLALGVLFYPIAPGRPLKNPLAPDWAPTVREALALREQLTNQGIYLPESAQVPIGRVARNIALRAGCRCELDKNRTVLIHPACPVHSATARANAPEPARTRPMPALDNGQPAESGRYVAIEGIPQLSSPPTNEELEELIRWREKVAARALAAAAAGDRGEG